jgi:hypothetical protein
MTLGSQRLPQGTCHFGLSSNFVILGSYAVDKRKGFAPNVLRRGRISE